MATSNKGCALCRNKKKKAEIHSAGSLAKRFGKTLTKPPHGLRRMEQREAKPFLACNMPCLETDCGLGSRNLTVTSLLRNDRHMPLAYSKSVKKGVEKTLEEVKQGKAGSISVAAKYTI